MTVRFEPSFGKGLVKIVVQVIDRLHQHLQAKLFDHHLTTIHRHHISISRYGYQVSSSLAKILELLFLRLDPTTHLFSEYVTFRMLGQDPLSFSVLVFQ